MNGRCVSCAFLLSGTLVFSTLAAPVIDPIPSASISAGKTLIVPVTTSSPNGRPLTFTATSSTNRITVTIHTGNPFWKMSVAQAAAANAPGAYQSPFRGGVATVTNMGDMTFMLFRDLAPHTVNVIQGLTAGGMYTSNTIFHRVIAGFMNQGGDPNTNGTGGPVFRFDDEFNSQAIFSGIGQLAMANSGKDTAGSQFFVTVAPYRFGDFGYTIFGQLLRGFNVLSNINNTATDANSRPLANVIITRASIVPDTSDTVLTLAGADVVGVAGTITVIADDGVGGRATNTFAATTITDTQNDPPFMINGAVTNLIAPINGKLTNTLSGLDLESNVMYYGYAVVDLNTYMNSTISFNGVNGQFVVIPNPGYSGPLSYSFAVSPNTGYSPYDSQTYTFAIGDTAISAAPSNFVATAGAPFTNLLLGTFTNGVPNSATNSFAAFINWGDNSTNGGWIVTNLAGRKEVRASHTYTNAGNYPVYFTIQSALGASATLVCTGSVPPMMSLTRTGTNNVVRWPAWTTDYLLQTAASITATHWPVPTNIAVLTGYELVITNSTTNGAFFFRLRK